MKKLIIGAAIAFAAVASQAASYQWNFSTGSAVMAGYEGKTVGAQTTSAVSAGLDAYFIYYYGGSGVSQSDLLAGLRDGKSISQIAGKWAIFESQTDGSGYVMQTADKALDTATYALDGNNKMNGYMVVLNEDDESVYLGGNTGTKVDELVAKSITPSVTSTKYQRDLDATRTYGSAGWYSYSTIPEPTSGVLLLLGMAGLALRRRRA